MTEQAQLEQEEAVAAAGQPPRDISEYSAWRETTDYEVMEALDLYATYLMGQSNGMSDSLDLAAIVAACDIEGVAQEDRPRIAQHVLMIRAAHAAKSRKDARRHGG